MNSYKHNQPTFDSAKKELGEKQFNKKLQTVFGLQVLNYVKTIVINLPGSCYANCPYCIDNSLRNHCTDIKTFLASCEKTFQEFYNRTEIFIKEISITGGSLLANDFNMLMNMIHKYYPDAKITWNTNGILIDETYDTSYIQYINLHRNSVNDTVNKKLFQTSQPILSIDQAKLLFQNKLCLRITVDKNFDLDEYANLNISLYLNKMLPETPETNQAFQNVLSKLQISDGIDIRRRNHYLNCMYKNTPVRICLGDKEATHIPNRYPVYLNVAIIHRSGKVCGSWFEDDKLLYDPYII